VYHTRDIKRGDVVVFNGLDSWDPEVQYSQPSNPVSKVLRTIGSAFGVVPGEKDYIKRVIGVPGDHVACCDVQGRVTVNGHPLPAAPLALGFVGAMPVVLVRRRRARRAAE